MLPEELSSKKEFDISIPHMSDYGVFYLIQKGRFSIWVDFAEVIIDGPALFYILPRQVKFMTSESYLEGWTLTVDPVLIDKGLFDIFEKEIFYPTPINASLEITGNLGSLIKILHSVRQSNLHVLNLQRHLANSCLGLFASAYSQNNARRQYPDNRQFQITQQFFERLRKGWQKEKSPAYYAETMNISLNYLNGCIKAITNNSISYWIQLEVIQQAKRMLYHSSFSVKEIAHELGFEDTAYFTRLFTKVTGKSPRQFRGEFLKNTIASEPEK